MKKSPRLDGKPYCIRLYLNKIKNKEQAVLNLWLKDNISGKYQIFRRARFLETIELYLASANDAIVVRIAWPDLYCGSCEMAEEI